MRFQKKLLFWGEKEKMVSYSSNFSFGESKMNWFEAKADCEAIGGKLVEIDSSEENAALAAEIELKLVVS